jgi:hypothetical protein
VQVAQGVIDLLGEVDEAFNSDRWAILDSRRQHATWLLYDGAALRNCCRLLYEIEVAAAAGLELSVRMLGRAHMEAWLVALYIHFGGYEALLRVAQDARHSLEGIELEARQFDEWLAAEKTAARKSGRKVAKTNVGIAQWNEKNPVGFQNSATGADLGFYATRSYSLMRPPRTGRRWIRSWERSATG